VSANQAASGATVEVHALSPESQPWKRFKEKVPAGGQTKIPKCKVTKATATKPKQTRKRPETVSKHFPVASAPELIEIDDDSLDLEPALKRRTDWTPTKNTKPPPLPLDSSIVKEFASPPPRAVDLSSNPRRDIFKSLADTYRCADVEDVSRASTPLDEPSDILGKRKLIELVPINDPKASITPEVSPTKQKAPKKKPRTITELATAAYRVGTTADESAGENQPRDETLLNYFSINEDSQWAETGEGKTKATAGDPKPGSKVKPKRAPKKKAEPSQPILLSPTSAMRQVSRQDFVFGTCSQLATEADAGLLQDLQRAMKDSNKLDDDDAFASGPINSDIAKRSFPNRLWGAGARDGDGELLEVEVIDLVDSPAIERDLTNPAVILSLASEEAKVSAKRVSEKVLQPALPMNEVDVVNISSPLTPALPTSHFFTTQTRVKPVAPGSLPPPTSFNSSIRQHRETANMDEGPPASNQEQYQLMSSGAADNSISTSHEVAPPKYELYTDGQLAKEVQSYGFKPIKRRTAAIALLVQCWSSKNQATSRTVNQGIPAFLSTSSAASVKAKPPAAAPKPRGRPKKIASAVEVSESEPASASGPAPVTKRPRGRPKKDAEAGGTTAPKRKPKTTTKASLPPSPPAPEPAPGPSTPKRRRKGPAHPVIEIADSDPEDLDGVSLSSATSSPGPADEFSSPVAGVDLSMTEAEDSVLSLTSSPTGQQSRLFRYITDAVRTAPRSDDSGNPSWHEKMLMYDPVVLEDLTSWLNAGQLDRVGYDDEVSAGDVKKWCESKSICCLWKVNLQGKERKRF
jgi:hypothetical protein